MAITYVPPDDQLARAVPWTRLRRDEDDNVIGVQAATFRLRKDEAYLSAAWLEYFDGSRQERIVSLVTEFRRSNMKPTVKSGFALGQNERIKDACAARNHRVRVIHEPTEDNVAHVAVRRWPVEDDLLCEQMAREVWSELIMNRDIP